MRCWTFQPTCRNSQQNENSSIFHESVGECLSHYRLPTRDRCLAERCMTGVQIHFLPTNQKLEMESKLENIHPSIASMGLACLYTLGYFGYMLMVNVEKICRCHITITWIRIRRVWNFKCAGPDTSTPLGSLGFAAQHHHITYLTRTSFTSDYAHCRTFVNVQISVLAPAKNPYIGTCKYITRIIKHTYDCIKIVPSFKHYSFMNACTYTSKRFDNQNKKTVNMMYDSFPNYLIQTSPACKAWCRRHK